MRTTINFHKLVNLKVMVAGLVFLQMFMFAQAQSVDISISPLRFAGVHALQSQQGINNGYLVLHTAQGGNWNYQMFNSELETLTQGTLEAPRYSFFNGLTTNGDYTLVNFVVNAFTQSSTYILLNSRGEEVNRVTRNDLQMLRRGEQFLPRIFNHPQGGFLVVETLRKGNSAGYRLEYLDTDLQSRWQKEFFAQRGHAHVYDIASNADGVFILEATERSNQTRNVRLHGIQASNGTHLYTMELTDDQYTYFPTALLPMSDGSIALSGTYFKGSRINSKRNQGVFFLGVSPEGNTLGMQNHPWKMLRPYLRTSVPDWFLRIMPDVWIHAMEQDSNGNFIAIAELYRYSGQVSHQERGEIKEQYHRIRLLDFMLFGFEQSGQMLYAERIEKPHMVIKLDAESAGGSGNLSLAAASGTLRRGRAMKQFDAFTYRFHQKTDDSFKIAFASYEAKTHFAYLMDLNSFDALKTELTHAKPKAISYAEIIQLCANQSGYGFILTELNTRKFDESEAYWRGILPARHNSMLTYEFMPLTGKLRLSLQELHTAK